MAINYTQLRNDVSAVIDEFGFAATLRKTTGGASTPWGTETPTETDTEITVVDDNIQNRYIDGTLTTRRARVLLVSVAAGVVPAKEDRVQVRGVWFDIEEVLTTAPGGVDLLYELELAI
jgi:hypothetical protein